MLTKFARWITRHPKIVVIVAAILIVPSAVGFLMTKVNYDILSYLPSGIESVDALDVLDKDFGEATMSIIIMKDMGFDEMKKTEEEISKVDNVGNVLWLGSVIDSPIPESMMPEILKNSLYNESGDSTLMLVQYTSRGSSEETLDAIKQIRSIMTKNCMMSGLSAVTYDLMELTNKEAPKYIAIAIVLALVALLLTMDSFVLPFVLLAALGMAVIYNMGTNFIFGQISFITQAIAAILQLAVTMDYSVFLMDRYREEKQKYKTREAAMSKAIVSSFTSLTGSSLTTVFGFLALCAMQLTLGKDIGLVMAKGVILGVATVVIVLPALLLLTENLVEKTMHKSIVPSFHKLNKVNLKARKVLAIVFVVLLIPSYLLQSNVKKYYNMMNAVPDGIASIEALGTMKDEFNMASSHFIVVDRDLSSADMVNMCDDIQNVDGMSTVLSLSSVLGAAIPLDIIPDSIKSMLANDKYQLVMANSIYEAAEDKANDQVDEINKIVKSYDKNGMVTGEPAMYKDLISITNRDFIVTNIVSIAAIFILIAIIFKSISIPLILVSGIELAIWINLAICTMMNETICFITPTIISAVQLGATVDYAILLATRYREELRSGKDRVTAMQFAADQADRSIFQSALVFFAATAGVMMICDIDIVKSICGMLARGAVISALVIIIFMTPVLTVCEGVIDRTTYGWLAKKDPTNTKKTRFELIREKREELQYLKKEAIYEKKLKSAVKHGKPLPEIPVRPEKKKKQNNFVGVEIVDEEDDIIRDKLNSERAIPVKADYVYGTIMSLRDAQKATMIYHERIAAEEQEKENQTNTNENKQDTSKDTCVDDKEDKDE